MRRLRHVGTQAQGLLQVHAHAQVHVCLFACLLACLLNVELSAHV